MGSQSDSETVYGKFTDEQLEEKFHKAVEDRLFDYGHRGYSGTLAEARTDYFYIFTEKDEGYKLFDTEEEATEYVLDNDGHQEPETVTINGVTKPTFNVFLQGFSRKNYTNCARFKGGAVFGGAYSY